MANNESSDDLSEQSKRKAKSNEDYEMPIWRKKRPRTARYEVNEPAAPIEPKKDTTEKNKKCEICKPNCPHWCSLEKIDKDRAHVKLRRKMETKEERSKRLGHQRVYQRNYYSKLTKDGKLRKVEKAKIRRKERLMNMTPSERKAWFKKNRGDS